MPALCNILMGNGGGGGGLGVEYKSKILVLDLKAFAV